ncbi:MAG TPA: hypothetical protein VHZ73_04940 [Vicinamibacterales bacterium]|jgi:uncharacterized protein YyaL (SSP411 family)|nr:hypothetical protein [Vicinamibacterales bacterium]
MVKIGRDTLERVCGDVLEAVDRVNAECGCATPAAITFLLRQYAHTGREDCRDAVGAALARALHHACVSPARDDASAWLPLFVEAASLSEDDRLVAMIESIAESLSNEWPARGAVASIARSVRAVLTASAIMDAAAQNARVVARAIDELERVVGHAYAPGSGLVHELGGEDAASGTLGDHAALASALLVAYSMTARLPYAMLADELMQHSTRRWWGTSGWDAPFPEACAASRVMCRLAALYRDDEYRAAAVTGEVDYAELAARGMAALDAVECLPRDRALFGLAVLELLEIQSAI